MTAKLDWHEARDRDVVRTWREATPLPARSARPPTVRQITLLRALSRQLGRELEQLPRTRSAARELIAALIRRRDHERRNGG